MIVHVVKETDAGIVLRGAKYETAASYPDQAFLKPTIVSSTDEQLSDYAVGCIVKMGRRESGIFAARALPAAPASPITRSPTASTRSAHWLSSTMCWCRGRTCSFIATHVLPRISAAPCTATAFSYVLRILYMADLMIGAALWNARQTGLDKLPAVRAKLADLVCYREGINAHIVAAITEA